MVVEGLIGKKIGMTQVFDQEGNIIPVTVLQVGPCAVVQVRTEERDGYRAAQLALMEREESPEKKKESEGKEGKKKRRKIPKPLQGHYAKAGVIPQRILREFKLGEGEIKEGQTLTVEIFEGVDRVDVTGTSKGRGFQGVMKRHGYSGGPSSHGSKFHRAPGSVGSTTFPGRVLKGKGMPGHMGNERVTAIGLRVVKIDKEKNLMLVKGAVPGPAGGYVLVKKSKRCGK